MVTYSTKPQKSTRIEGGEQDALEKKARDRRNRALAFSLVGFVVLIFGVTVMRLTSNIASGAG